MTPLHTDVLKQSEARAPNFEAGPAPELGVVVTLGSGTGAASEPRAGVTPEFGAE